MESRMEGFDWFKESSLGAVMLYLPFPDCTEALRPWQIPTELILSPNSRFASLPLIF